jgi:hypothetical protein
VTVPTSNGGHSNKKLGPGKPFWPPLEQTLRGSGEKYNPGPLSKIQIWQATLNLLHCARQY